MITFVTIDKSNPRAGSADGKAELIYKSRRFPKSHGGFKRPPYNVENYFYVVQTAKKMGGHRSRPHDAEVCFYAVQVEKKKRGATGPARTR